MFVIQHPSKQEIACFRSLKHGLFEDASSVYVHLLQKNSITYLEGYVSFTNAKRSSFLDKRLPGSIIEPYDGRGTPRPWEQVSGKVIGGPWVKNKLSKQALTYHNASQASQASRNMARDPCPLVRSEPDERPPEGQPKKEALLSQIDELQAKAHASIQQVLNVLDASVEKMRNLVEESFREPPQYAPSECTVASSSSERTTASSSSSFSRERLNSVIQHFVSDEWYAKEAQETFRAWAKDRQERFARYGREILPDKLAKHRDTFIRAAKKLSYEEALERWDASPFFSETEKEALRELREAAPESCSVAEQTGEPEAAPESDYGVPAIADESEEDPEDPEEQEDPGEESDSPGSSGSFGYYDTPIDDDPVYQVLSESKNALQHFVSDGWESHESTLSYQDMGECRFRAFCGYSDVKYIEKYAEFREAFLEEASKRIPAFYAQRRWAESAMALQEEACMVGGKMYNTEGFIPAHSPPRPSLAKERFRSRLQKRTGSRRKNAKYKGFYKTVFDSLEFSDLSTSTENWAREVLLHSNPTSLAIPTQVIYCEDEDMYYYCEAENQPFKGSCTYVYWVPDPCGVKIAEAIREKVMLRGSNYYSNLAKMAGIDIHSNDKFKTDGGMALDQAIVINMEEASDLFRLMTKVCAIVRKHAVYTAADLERASEQDGREHHMVEMEERHEKAAQELREKVSAIRQSGEPDPEWDRDMGEAYIQALFPYIEKSKAKSLIGPLGHRKERFYASLKSTQ